jgi:hypothetical protein
MTMRILFLVTMMACAARSSTVVSNRASDSPTALMHEADAIMRELARPSYDLPYTNREERLRARVRAWELYEQACSRETPRACWLSPGGPQVDRVLESLCRDGDVMSCDAIQSRPWGQLSYECGLDKRKCSISELRRDCDYGLTFGCIMLHRVQPSRDLLARIHELGKQGCAIGISNDCAALYEDLDDDDAMLLACSYDATKCPRGERFWSRLVSRDPVKARGFMERACQLADDFPTCVTLGQLYIKGVLAEPVSGRGLRLIEFACKQGGATPSECRSESAP